MSYYNGAKIRKNNSKWRTENNKVINHALATNYDLLMNYDGLRSYIDGKPLLSWSTATKGLTEIAICMIPKDTMQLLQDEGTAIMYYLELVANKEIKDLKEIDFMSEKVKKMFYALMQCFIDNELQVLAVEKHICNNRWHGYVDCIVMRPDGVKAIVEIKTRSNFEVRNTDILQLSVYNAILTNEKLSKLLVIINRKTFNAQVFQINHGQCKMLVDKMNAWLEAINLGQYKLEFKDKRKKKQND